MYKLEIDVNHTISIGKAFTDHPEAIKLIDALNFFYREGHLCLPLDSLEESDSRKMHEMISSCPKHLISFEEMAPSKPLYFVNNHLYLHKYFRYETTFIKNLLRYLSSFENKSLSTIATHQDPQTLAIEKALLPGMLILTGGPGTGKTFTAKKIAERLLESSTFFKKSIILAAPTTKALDQLKKSIGKLNSDVEIISNTLHKLVELKSKKPAYLNASCILIDEASMIDAALMSKLFASLGSETKILFLGDPFQLPPIGSGALFQDLIALSTFHPYIHHVHLEKIYRSHNPFLHEMAAIVKQKKANELLDFLNQKDSPIVFHKEPLDIDEHLFLKKLASFFDEEDFFKDSIEDLREWKQRSIILSTLRKGHRGVDYINQFLSRDLKAKKMHKRFYIEPVIVTETHKALELFNGETGIKIYDRLNHQEFFIFKDCFFYNLIDLCYCPSFAISVHKSQGSEYEKVFFLLPKGSENFSREIIYTAVTRVKNHLEIWIDQESLALAFENSSHRCSNALQRILKHLKDPLVQTPLEI